MGLAPRRKQSTIPPLVTPMRGHDTANWRSLGTAIYSIVASGRFGALRRLVEAGANPNAANERGNTALMLAARVCPTQRGVVVHTLLDWGADPCLFNVKGDIALHLASVLSICCDGYALIARPNDAEPRQPLRANVPTRCGLGWGGGCCVSSVVCGGEYSGDLV